MEGGLVGGGESCERGQQPTGAVPCLVALMRASSITGCCLCGAGSQCVARCQHPSLPRAWSGPCLQGRWQLLRSEGDCVGRRSGSGTRDRACEMSRHYASSSAFQCAIRLPACMCVRQRASMPSCRQLRTPAAQAMLANMLLSGPGSFRREAFLLQAAAAVADWVLLGCCRV